MCRAISVTGDDMWEDCSAACGAEGTGVGAGVVAGEFVEVIDWIKGLK